MKARILFLTLLCLLATTASFAQTRNTLNCKFLKSCKLKYTDQGDTTSYVIIKNKKHVEYHQDGGYFIKSDLEWVSDCEYNATMTEITLPNFPFKPGEVMNVKFIKIDNGVVFGKGTVRGQTFPVVLRIIN